MVKRIIHISNNDNGKRISIGNFADNTVLINGTMYIDSTEFQEFMNLAIEVYYS